MTTGLWSGQAALYSCATCQATAVWEGLGKAAQEDEFAVMDDLCRATGVPIPKNLQGLQEKEVRHRDVIKKEDMLSYVLGKVKEDAWKK